MSKIRIVDEARSFAENKDVARDLRENRLRPAFEAGEQTELDFSGVEGATQSFIHALVSGLIRETRGEILDRLVFSNCNQAIKSVVAVVVEYSQIEPFESER